MEKKVYHGDTVQVHGFDAPICFIAGGEDVALRNGIEASFER